MKDKMNIYSANINSNESGVATYPTDEHDTFFKVSYNHGGSSRIINQRLVLKQKEFQTKYLESVMQQ